METEEHPISGSVTQFWCWYRDENLLSRQSNEFHLIKMNMREQEPKVALVRN